MFEEELHAKRVASRIDGVDGVRHAATVGIRAIGPGWAAAQGRVPKHAITQGGRRLSNARRSMQESFACWVPCVVAGRAEIVVNFDGTAVEDAAQRVVGLGMQPGHGRSTPLVWATVRRSERKGQRTDPADARLGLLALALPEGVRVTVVADRGVTERRLLVFLREALGFDDLIRGRAHLSVEGQRGEGRKAAAGGAGAGACGCAETRR
jgi:hypothetical protein